MARVTFGLGLAAILLAQAGTARAPAGAAAALDALKGLSGHWRVAGDPRSTLGIDFTQTAGGTVVVEEWRRGGKPFSLTLYHRDGAALIATHYCPQGNQPRLSLAPGATPARIAFTFRDATDLDPDRESYLTALSFDLSSPDMLVRRESYREQGVDHPAELRLVRDP